MRAEITRCALQAEKRRQESPRYTIGALSPTLIRASAGAPLSPVARTDLDYRSPIHQLHHVLGVALT
jgi:hypothetical protein